MKPTQPTFNRRGFLGVVAALLAWAHVPVAWAARPDAFSKEAFGESLNSLFGSGSYTTSDMVAFKAPEIAENGAVVPVTVKYPNNAKRIALFVEENQQPLTAVFNLSSRSVADVSTRIKMAESSIVHAVVETADGSLLGVSKEVKVTIGGCGG